MFFDVDKVKIFFIFYFTRLFFNFFRLCLYFYAKILTKKNKTLYNIVASRYYTVLFYSPYGGDFILSCF